MEFKIALGQMAVAAGQPARNYDTAREMAAEAAGRGADLLLLPELWATGYDLGRARQYARPLDEGHFAWMAGLAQEHRLYVAGTCLEASAGGKPWNSAALYGPDGCRHAAYRKVHLFAPMGEVAHLAAGEELPVFDLPWGRLALAICYDLRFPEGWVRYAEAGAQLVLIPAEWPVGRVEHWRLLLRARAVENQLFVAGCNRTGTDADGEFPGHSAIVDPWGRVRVEGSADPGLLFASVDLDDVQDSRRVFHWYGDRRPEVYARR